MQNKDKICFPKDKFFLDSLKLFVIKYFYGIKFVFSVPYILSILKNVLKKKHT